MSIVRLSILGTLGTKAELKTFNRTNKNNSNEPSTLINFAIAVNNPTKNEQGDWTDNTQWYNVVAFGYTAEKIANYKIGDTIYLDCDLKTSKWKEAETGKDMSRLEITASYSRFISRRQEAQPNSQQQIKLPVNKTSQKKPSTQHDEDEIMFEFDDDVIPFPA
jgi:single-strand DNA-binding protein